MRQAVQLSLFTGSCGTLQGTSSKRKFSLPPYVKRAVEWGGGGGEAGDGHTKHPCTWAHCCLAMPEAGTEPHRLLRKDQFVV